MKNCEEKIIKTEYISTEEGIRVDKFLSAQEEKYTRSFIQKLMDNNQVIINGNDKIKASYKVKKGDKIVVLEPEPIESHIGAEKIDLDIVYEDNDIIIVNKPKHMVVHPASGNYTGTMVNGLMYSHKNELSGINGVVRPGIVHRIDKDTTGLLVVAKNDNSHKKLSDKFKVHDITRTYIALVNGVISKDKLVINLPIGRSESDRKKMWVTRKNSKSAITHVTVLERYIKSGYTLIQANLETGRTHQIRVHMSYAGHPVIGDAVYGKAKNEFGIEGQLLHAKQLGFEHPSTGQYMEWQVELPKEFKDILNSLRKKEK